MSRARYRLGEIVFAVRSFSRRATGYGFRKRRRENVRNFRPGRAVHIGRLPRPRLTNGFARRRRPRHANNRGDR